MRLSHAQREILYRLSIGQILSADGHMGLPEHRYKKFDMRVVTNLERRGLIWLKLDFFYVLTDAGRNALLPVNYRGDQHA